ncbi:protein TolQ [Methylotenera sp.]|jgi:biopolymer transport protein TolQ|uniref:protein TolQ n=1 Tax=Methylotenera sp. TaxID=2051956 RepID=UPI0027267B43|nr:protein TolQ [Methylotenera sp.]MDO9205630.1 protein TolQ [Methylotenera sp.]MDP1524155.1 protein TolQ [Methylotenera sp.]MDP1766353.1 protein TolQ [Methylotenera sp.]MDP2070649.1 protein TolQ [Methylotenera sp.]MDP2231267.1 protein TolQ [Methylotenera sp.]
MTVSVANDMSIFSLVAGASLPVQLVMLILMITSLFSWWYIFIKFFTIKRAEADAENFENSFWTGGDLNKLYEGLTAGRRKPQGMASIFEAGFKEYARHKQQSRMEVSDVMEGSRRAMRAAYNRELDDLDAHLPFLASVGSVSPYIGLFGTVWGIMNAFRGLSTVAQATLSQVAPGIAEALVATAIGLFAAIPAVVAYNRFASSVDRLSVRYESFMEEFTNILQRKS